MFVITRREEGKIKDMVISDDKNIIAALEYEWMIELAMGELVEDQWNNLRDWYEDLSKDQNFDNHIERFEVEHFDDRRTWASVVSEFDLGYAEDTLAKIVFNATIQGLPDEPKWEGAGVIPGWAEDIESKTISGRISGKPSNITEADRIILIVHEEEED